MFFAHLNGTKAPPILHWKDKHSAKLSICLPCEKEGKRILEVSGFSLKASDL